VVIPYPFGNQAGMALILILWGVFLLPSSAVEPVTFATEDENHKPAKRR
jgi:hypothetical protein